MGETQISNVIKYDATGKLVSTPLVTVDDASNPSFATLQVTGLTASTALTTDATKFIVSSSTTATELGYVHGVTSAIQTQLTNISGVANGALPLSGGTLTGSLTAPSLIHNGSSSPALAKFTGKASDASTDTGGVEMYLLHNGTNNRQLVMAATDSAMTDSESGVIFFVGNAAPVIYAGEAASGTPNSVLGLGSAVYGVALHGPTTFVNVTSAQRTALTVSAGTVVYDTDLVKLCVYTTAWEAITSTTIV